VKLLMASCPYMLHLLRAEILLAWSMLALYRLCFQLVLISAGFDAAHADFLGCRQ
jgi:hypothetical protein